VSPQRFKIFATIFTDCRFNSPELPHNQPEQHNICQVEALSSSYRICKSSKLSKVQLNKKAFKNYGKLNKLCYVNRKENEKF
jgi:hypothetical protein